MLIKCPECNKEISDKSTVCIHCGYPIGQKEEKNNICIINNIEYDFSDIMQILPKVGNKDTDVHPLYIGRMVKDRTSLDWKSADELGKIIVETKSIPKSYNGSIEIKTTANSPKCPTCNSTNIKKISGTKRFVTTGLFGLASSNIGKTMECKNCGAKW